MIAVALSGGVDSFASALLLKNKGYKIFGIHFLTGYETNEKKNIEIVQKNAQLLDIKCETINIKEVFQKYIVDYFVDSYQKCLTPNPCMLCNSKIKFTIILDYVLKLGATHLATGHYAKIEKNGKYCLLKGDDKNKDQSYFLALLNQNQLKHALFPLAYETKENIKKLCLSRGFLYSQLNESQEICFIKNQNYSSFLSEQKNFKKSKGPIINTDGKIIGNHQGLHAFTIGQRKGINCPAPWPYYVVKLDHKNNALIVGKKNDLMSYEFNVNNINWIQDQLIKTTQINVRIRYRCKEIPAAIIPKDNNCAAIKFDKPQMAVTPGQVAVFYIDNKVIGGGFIS